MAHAQKPDFVFRAKRTSTFKSAGGRQFSGLMAAEVCGISGSNAGYTMFRGSVKGTGYSLHSSVPPSLPLLCVTVCHHISTGVYLPLCFLPAVSDNSACVLLCVVSFLRYHLLYGFKILPKWKGELIFGQQKVLKNELNDPRTSQ